MPNNIDNSAVMKELARRELAKRHLRYFTTYNFPTFEVNWHHEVIMKALEDVEKGDIKRLMIMLPPRHGKSELASIQFPAWFMGRNPTKDIIAASYSADLALDFGRKVRNLANSQEYKNIFDIQLAEDSMSAGKWHTGEGGAYTATGVGGAITGKGANVLIIDDPIKNRDDAESPLLRMKLWDWYRSTAYTRLSPGGAVIVIQTRWHDGDLAGMLLRETGDKWDIIELPAIATHDERNRKVDEALWPSRYSVQTLNQIQKVIGPYEWSALYQQNPIAAESQEFYSDWFQSRPMEEVRKLKTQPYLTVDTAVSKAAHANHTGFCINLIDDQNKWNLKAWRVKINPTELLDTLFTLHKEYFFYKIGIEKTIFLQAIQPFLNEEMRKRGVYLPIVELYHGRSSKDIRIRGLIPRYQSKSVYHIKDECYDLEEELLRFPRSTRDDVMDATAYQVQIAEEFISIPNQEFKLYSQDFS